jgi:hypothetical protein
MLDKLFDQMEHYELANAFNLPDKQFKKCTIPINI